MSDPSDFEIGSVIQSKSTGDMGVVAALDYNSQSLRPENVWVWSPMSDWNVITPPQAA